MNLGVKKLSEDAKLPAYANIGDAGMDIFSNECLIIGPKHRAAVRTGLVFEIPKGCVGLVWDKSGVAFKSGIKTMAGVIDSGYRGELKVVLINLSSDDFKIDKGQKIAQMLIQKIERPNINLVEEVTNTKRGEKGFGSSGLS
jgi:dUTP pyrophosphatase